MKLDLLISFYQVIHRLMSSPSGLSWVSILVCYTFELGVRVGTTICASAGARPSGGSGFRITRERSNLVVERLDLSLKSLNPCVLLEWLLARGVVALLQESEIGCDGICLGH